MSLWRLGISGQGVTVALLDTGIMSEYAAQAPITDNLDFTGENDPTTRVLPHGSQMARLINTVAPNAAIANLKVIPFNGNPSRKMVERAIDYCIEHYPDIRILNLSLWFEPRGCKEGRCSLCNKIDRAIDAGLIVVTSAGNRGPKPDTLTCPAYAKKVISVAATWPNEVAEWWENLPWWQKTWKKAIGTFSTMFGTSISAANTSGGLALLLASIPQATPEDIRWAISESARRLDAPVEAQGAGMVQFYPAYLLLQQRFGESNPQT